jgi:menaquinone-dependent protoporphyrinogen oxidase
MANIGILYATRDGHTGKIAERIAEVLRTNGHRVEVSLCPRRGAADLDLARLDGLILGSSVRGGRHHAEIARFIREHRESFVLLETAFFSVGLALTTPKGRSQAQSCVDKLCADTHWRPGRVELFAGALAWTHYGRFQRWFMKRIVKNMGLDTDTSRDQEYTDWNTVGAFARSFGRSMADTPATLVAPPRDVRPPVAAPGAVRPLH